MPTTRTEPFMSVLVDGTVPEYSSGTPDNGQTIYPGLLVYKSGTAPDPEFTVCSANYGSSIEDEATIYIVEIPPSHPSFPQAYTMATAFTAETDTMTVHRLSIGDRIWVKGSNLSVNETDILVCQTAGLVVQTTGDTADKWNCHGFRVIGTWSTATYVIVEYMGLITVDSA